MSAPLAAAAFDVLPTVAFVMDRDMRIYAANAAALRLTGAPGATEVLLRRGGDVLRCVNSTLNPGGCGCADGCKTCVLRISTGRAATTRSLVRGKTRFHRSDGTGTRDSFFLVTATPVPHEGEPLALLTLDDLGEQLKVRGILPFCSGCHRVRNELNEWEDAQRYVADQLALDPSHGLCEPCLQRLYPE